MDVIHLQKAFAFIAKGLVEKEKLLKNAPNRYPYSRDLQRGINMFLAACLELGGMGENTFKYADESSFLAHYICKPICEWFDAWDKTALQFNKIETQQFYEYGPFAFRRGKADLYTPTEECIEFLNTLESNIIEGTDERALYEKIKNNYQFKIMLYNQKAYHIYNLKCTDFPILNISYKSQEDIGQKNIQMEMYLFDNLSNIPNKITISGGKIKMEEDNYVFSLHMLTPGKNKRDNKLSILNMKPNSEFILKPINNEQENEIENKKTN